VSKSNQTKKQKRTFRFQKHDNIGAYDAIEDSKFLNECFVDRGELRIIRDTTNPQCLVLGRTGSGKTALLEQLADETDHVIRIVPDNLALTYISNNQMLRFFMDAGVDMDLFYRFLWRHVLTVELIKDKYNIVNERKRDDFLDLLKKLIQPKATRAREDAIAYLIEWGQSFWKETDYRVKEITNTLEKNFQKSLNASLNTSMIPGLASSTADFVFDNSRQLSEQAKAEVIRHGQNAVNEVQMAKLSEIMKILEDHVFNNPQVHYYVAIDRLDEKWINDGLRYHLIRALLETTREFNKTLSNVKIIIAMREDLLDRVFRYTRDAGYQEEKYKSMYLPLSWTSKDLEALLDKRVNFLVKEMYTNDTVSLRQLLPASNIERSEPVEYLLSRTLFRPRDAISFLNECIKAAEGKTTITKENILTAEASYSESRLRALQDEWYADYQNLIELTLALLKKRSPSFRLSDFTPEVVDGVVLELTMNKLLRPDPIKESIDNYMGNGDLDVLVKKLIGILYKVGIIGIKPDTYHSVYWAFQNPQLIDSQYDSDTGFHIHPAFWRFLGIRST